MTIVGLAALLCGMALTRLRQPALVGYILAGVLLGPSVFSLVDDRELIGLFSEIGVLMLLFLIGMELPLHSFLRVWRMALACTVLQIVGSLCFAFALTWVIDWTFERAIIAGFVMALSSTAVAIKILEEIGELDSETGRITLAVLIAQDLAVVPMMLVLRDLSDGGGISIGGFAQVAFAIAFLIGCLIHIDRKGSLRLPLVERIAGNDDLRAIATLALCLAAATASGLLGLSPAYGAFLAGIFIGNTDYSKEMIRSTPPIQSLFMMVFFLSVGLLIDLGFIWRNLGEVVVWLLAVTLFKTALNIGILRLLGNPWDRSFLSGVVMGQIGEFSFVMVAAALASGLVVPERYPLTVAVIALSLVISPLWLAVAHRLVHIMALSITSFREIVRLLLGDQALELAARSRLAARQAAAKAARAAAEKLQTMRNGGRPNGVKDGRKIARDTAGSSGAQARWPAATAASAATAAATAATATVATAGDTAAMPASAASAPSAMEPDDANPSSSPVCYADEMAPPNNPQESDLSTRGREDNPAADWTAPDNRGKTDGSP